MKVAPYRPLDKLSDVPQITSDLIMRAVCQYYQITRDNLLSSDRRNPAWVKARTVVAYLIREDTKLSNQKIGKILGGRDHQVVVRGHASVQDKWGEYKEEVEAIRASYRAKLRKPPEAT